jgi:hypothetical protein
LEPTSRCLTGQISTRGRGWSRAARRAQAVKGKFIMSP